MNEQQIEVLLVEDNPDDVELTLHAFKAHKIANRIHVVRDGVEAIEFLFGVEHTPLRGTAGTPRLILLDLKLPRLEGLEVLRQIKADPRTRTIPVVVMTSSREERDLVESYHLGVNSYIVKPVDFEQFIEAVQKIGFYWLLLNHPPILPQP
jgi:two-component system response regulator